MSQTEALQWRNSLRQQGRKLVFTNGVFDILHAGHLQSLITARSFGAALMIGLNTDASVRRLKGESRPIIGQQDRALLLAALECVDAVVLFDQDTPLELISSLLPDVLVKSADYKVADIAGASEVIAAGGEVRITPFTAGLSTTNIIQKIKNQ
ncbi:D-glycero-beta-D-manno-heptose 1-phosphate adenylyltransferase [Niabella terrae]